MATQSSCVQHYKDEGSPDQNSCWCKQAIVSNAWLHGWWVKFFLLLISRLLFWPLDHEFWKLCSCKVIFLLSILYTALGHYLDQKGLWDPCGGQVIYRRSYITESYLGGRALRCSLKEDYFCMVPGYGGERVSSGTASVAAWLGFWRRIIYLFPIQAGYSAAQDVMKR